MRIFVSYQYRDADWAQWIAWTLEAEGHRVTVQAWDFTAGANFALEMHNAVISADCVIAVLSQNFLNSQFAAAEWAAAFAIDPTGVSRRLIPVRIAPCRPPGLLAQIVYVDLLGLSEAQAASALTQAVDGARRKPLHAPAFPKSEAEGRNDDVNYSGAEGCLSDRDWYFSDTPPRSPSLSQLLSPPSAVDEARERWETNESTRLTATIGVGRSGEPVAIDIAADGPCGYVIGSSGTGTSELLRTLACSLATNFSPGRVRLQLVGEKGGGVWRSIENLPHVGSVFADTYEMQSRAAFARFAQHLVETKMEVLRQSNTPDITRYNQSGIGHRLPIDVVLVDECLGDEGLGWELVRLQRIGRSLGVAVVAAAAAPRFLPPQFEAIARFGIFMGSHGLGAARDFALFHRVDASFGSEVGRAPTGRALLARTHDGVQVLQGAWTGGWAPGHVDSLYIESPTLDVLVSLLSKASRPS
jgi:hypothetical protein